MKSHEYNNVDNGLPITAQTVLVPRLFSISMADNPSVLCLSCGYDLTNLPLGRRSLNVRWPGRSRNKAIDIEHCAVDIEHCAVDIEHCALDIEHCALDIEQLT